MIKLKVITPNQILFESSQVESVNLPTKKGEITVLPNHIPLFTLLTEGIVGIKEKNKKEKNYYAIGRGYFETDGKEAILLVDRAFGQDDLNEKLIEKALKQAKEQLKKAPTEEDRKKAQAMLRRSTLDRDLYHKLLKKRRKVATS